MTVNGSNTKRVTFSPTFPVKPDRVGTSIPPERQGKKVAPPKLLCHDPLRHNVIPSRRGIVMREVGEMVLLFSEAKDWDTYRPTMFKMLKRGVFNEICRIEGFDPEVEECARGLADDVTRILFREGSTPEFVVIGAINVQRVAWHCYDKIDDGMYQGGDIFRKIDELADELFSIQQKFCGKQLGSKKFSSAVGATIEQGKEVCTINQMNDTLCTRQESKRNIDVRRRRSRPISPPCDRRGGGHLGIVADPSQILQQRACCHPQPPIPRCPASGPLPSLLSPLARTSGGANHLNQGLSGCHNFEQNHCAPSLPPCTLPAFSISPGFAKGCQQLAAGFGPQRVGGGLAPAWHPPRPLQDVGNVSIALNIGQSGVDSSGGQGVLGGRESAVQCVYRLVPVAGLYCPASEATPAVMSGMGWPVGPMYAFGGHNPAVCR